jgi:hypothetical protein
MRTTTKAHTCKSESLANEGQELYALSEAWAAVNPSHSRKLRLQAERKWHQSEAACVKCQVENCPKHEAHERV